MDAFLPPVGDKRPEKLVENIWGERKPKGKDSETKVQM